MNKREIKNFNSRKSFSYVETFGPLNEDLGAHSPAVKHILQVSTLIRFIV